MLKHITTIALGLTVGAVSFAQRSQIGDAISLKNVIAPEVSQKADSNMVPESFYVPGCDTLRLYTTVSGYIFGLNNFLDMSKGFLFNGNGTVPGVAAFYGAKVLLDTGSTGGTYMAHIYEETSPGQFNLLGSSIPVPFASIDTSMANGPQYTIFPFLPPVSVSGNFLVMFDVFSLSDTTSGAVIWANGPTCGTDKSYETYMNQSGNVVFAKISATWTSGGAGLKADPYVGITIQGFTGNEEFLTPSSLMAYPNPANENTIISFGAEANVRGRIDIMNLAGQQVGSLETDFVQGKNQIEVSLSGLANGIYVYHVTAGAQKMSGKLVVNH
ncbi:MAG: T9SS type A sorting domain-containing protein [Bacteroidetes bacterium]|nr:T9SS type A sorting domain-containing protein [Bacteroidota bacterium]